MRTHAHPDELVPGARAPEALQPPQALDGSAEATVHQGARRLDPRRRRKLRRRRRCRADRGVAEAGDRVELQRRSGQDQPREVQGEGD